MNGGGYYHGEDEGGIYDNVGLHMERLSSSNDAIQQQSAEYNNKQLQQQESFGYQNSLWYYVLSLLTNHETILGKVCPTSITIPVTTSAISVLTD